MSRIVKGVAEQKVIAHRFIACDRCKVEVRYDNIDVLATWVCCHKVYTQDAHTAQEIPALTDGEVHTMPVKDELHVCAECWKLGEAAMQPPKATRTTKTCPHGFKIRGLCPSCVTTERNPYAIDTPVGALVAKLQRNGVPVDIDVINEDRDYYEHMQNISDGCLL